ncbi:DUF1592 domain-containing protein [Agaribacterium haliotis]|uniref:DUF1592 domain-containing protein n=1 Tax=Agaribacterium haliotis TaxID=2013869 RepID=UPI001178A2C9|nr:DUF1592 domain-containing protein [Agaribacterium haliotis]
MALPLFRKILVLKPLLLALLLSACNDINIDSSDTLEFQPDEPATEPGGPPGNSGNVVNPQDTDLPKLTLEQFERGGQLYAAQCQACHGRDGKGGAFALFVNANDADAIADISYKNMPTSNPALCDLNCAEDISHWLIEKRYPGSYQLIAIEQNEPDAGAGSDSDNTGENNNNPDSGERPPAAGSGDQGDSSITEPNDDQGETQTPGLSPDLPMCPTRLWQKAATYALGDEVLNNTGAYRCKIPGWCSSPASWAYEPGKGLFWQEAWSSIDCLATVPDDSTPDNSTPDNSTPDNSTPDNSTPDNSIPDNSAPENDLTAQAEALFNEHCLSCHVASGLGGDLWLSQVQSRWAERSFNEFSTKVAAMPAPECTDACQQTLASWIWQRWGYVEQETSARALGVRGIRLLSPYEYKNIIRDVLGVELAHDELPPARFDADFKYATQSDRGVVLETQVRQYQQLASTVSQAADLSRFGCGLSCADNAIEQLILHLFRRPASNEQLTRYRRYQQDHGPDSMLNAMLMSPYFLYHIELGSWNEDDKRYELDAYERAAHLSFRLWGTSPDSTLLERAGQGELNSKQGLSDHVDTMLSDARFATHFAEFIRYYTNTYARLPEKPGLTREIIDAMQQEQQLAIADLFNRGSATIDELFNPEFTFVNAALAEHYGINSAEPDFVKVATNDRRGGLLHHGATQVHNSDFSATSLVKRGKMMRENMLCHSLGVPSGVDPANIQLPSHAISTRERWQLITGPEASEGQCWSCHQLMNEPGVAMEHFDHAGRYRTSETSFNVDGVQLAIDATGVLRDNSGAEYLASYSTLRDLSIYFASSEQLRACFVDNLYRFSSGHEADENSDAGIQAIADSFELSGDIRELMRDLVLSDVLLYRQ